MHFNKRKINKKQRTNTNKMRTKMRILIKRINYLPKNKQIKEK